MQVTLGKVGGVLLALGAAGLVLALWPRPEPGVPEAITRRIVEMTAEAERKDVAEVMEGVSERFRSQEGWGKQEVKQVLLAQVLRGEWVRIFTTDLQVKEVSPTRGEFQVKFIFGRSQASKLEELARDSILNAYFIEGAFEKEEDGQWRVVEAKHRPLNPSELL